MEQPKAPLLLDEREVAEMLGVDVAIVRRWRLSRQGPRFIQLGRSVRRYRVTDVLAWIESRLDGGEPLEAAR
jgi:predicted DNA-binding transcriptional regulator AlpA